MDTENDHVVAQSGSAYEHDCVIRSAEHLGQAINLLRMADTVRSRELAEHLRPFVEIVEKAAE